jgi:hypothetical protein
MYAKRCAAVTAERYEGAYAQSELHRLIQCARSHTGRLSLTNFNLGCAPSTAGNGITGGQCQHAFFAAVCMHAAWET